MTQLTVRGFDAELERVLRGFARQRGISLNRAALELMRKGIGLAEGTPEAGCVGTSLDHLIGTMSDDEAGRILEAVESCNQVDEGLWR
jgi:hypothetical protein